MVNRKILSKYNALDHRLTMNLPWRDTTPPQCTLGRIVDVGLNVPQNAICSGGSSCQCASSKCANALAGLCEYDFFGSIKAEAVVPFYSQFTIAGIESPYWQGGKFTLTGGSMMDVSGYSVNGGGALLSTTSNIYLQNNSSIRLPPTGGNTAFTLMSASSTIAFPQSVSNDISGQGWTFANNAPGASTSPRRPRRTCTMRPEARYMQLIAVPTAPRAPPVRNLTPAQV